MEGGVLMEEVMGAKFPSITNSEIIIITIPISWWCEN
jgi:hypothetical protein